MKALTFSDAPFAFDLKHTQDDPTIAEVSPKTGSRVLASYDWRKKNVRPIPSEVNGLR